MDAPRSREGVHRATDAEEVLRQGWPNLSNVACADSDLLEPLHGMSFEKW